MLFQWWWSTQQKEWGAAQCAEAGSSTKGVILLSQHLLAAAKLRNSCRWLKRGAFADFEEPQICHVQTNNQGYLEDPHSKSTQKALPKYVWANCQYFKTLMLFFLKNKTKKTPPWGLLIALYFFSFWFSCVFHRRKFYYLPFTWRTLKCGVSDSKALLLTEAAPLLRLTKMPYPQGYAAFSHRYIMHS